MSSSLHTSSVSSLFLFSHSRFSSNSTGFTDTDPRCIFLSSGIYVCVYVCASRRIRHTEDTRIQAEQIKRRLPGIIRSVARRGARTNQAASLFPAPELAFLFFPPLLSFFSFLFFTLSLSFFFFCHSSFSLFHDDRRDREREETRNFAPVLGRFRLNWFGHPGCVIIIISIVEWIKGYGMIRSSENVS